METSTINATTVFDSGNSNFWYPNTYTPFVETVYLPYISYWNNESRIEKAFKLVKILMEKNIIKEPKTVKDFIELVNSISEIV